MRIIECDRCHKRIENKDEVGYVALDWKSIKTGDLAGASTFDNWDLCDDCMKKITDFVQHMIPRVTLAEDDKPKAVIRRPITADTKYSPITQEKIEQIKALSRDGKTVKEIVSIVGVSDPTVRKYKAEVTLDEDQT